MHTPKTRNPLYCDCRAHRLLAFYGLDADGEIYFHVKAHKGGKTLANVVIFGDCEIQCPSCSLWHIFTFRDDGSLDKNESKRPPAEIADLAAVGDTDKP